MSDKQEQVWVDKARAALEQSASELEPDVSAKLANIRERTLDEFPERESNIGWWMSAGIAATVCVALVVFTLIPKPSEEPVSPFEEIELITTTDDLDLYEELDFYEWLEEYDLPT